MKPFFLNEPKRCAPQVADHPLDLAHFRRRRRRRGGARPGMPQPDGIQQLRHRLADRRPVRGFVVPGPGQRFPQARQPGRRPAAPSARSGAATAAAPGCRARSGRTCRDAGRRFPAAARGDRRHHRATGRPSGPSAPGRPRLRCDENSLQILSVATCRMSHRPRQSAQPGIDSVFKHRPKLLENGVKRLEYACDICHIKA